MLRYATCQIRPPILESNAVVRSQLTLLVSEWVIKFNSLSRTPERKAHVIHISCHPISTCLVFSNATYHISTKIFNRNIVARAKNSLVPGRCSCNIKLGNFRWVIFMQMLVIVGCRISHETAFRWMSMDLPKVNIGWGNGLVPSGNKPLPGPVLTQTYVTIWDH